MPSVRITRAPAPSCWGEHIPTDAQIDKLRHASRTSEDAVRLAGRILAERQQALAGIQTEWLSVMQQLGPAHSQPLEVITSQRAAAEEYDRKTADAAARLPMVEQELLAAREQVAQASTHAEQVEQQERTEAAHLEAALAVLAARERAIPAQLGSRQTFDQALAEAEQTVAQLAKALDAAQQEVAQARVTVAARGSALDEQIRAAERAHERAEQQRALFAARVLQAGFADEADYQSAVLAAEAIERVDTGLREYDQRRAGAERVLGEATAAAANVEAPDLAALHAASDRLQRDHDALLAQVGTLQSMATERAPCARRTIWRQRQQR